MITFSHTDEAKKALLITEGELIIDTNFCNILGKGKLDHSEMDRAYFMRKIMNESKMVD